MKQAIAARKKQIQVALTESRKELRKAEKAKDRSEIKRLKSEIEFLEKQKDRYSASAHPIQFDNGCVIDLNLVKEYAKKLPTGNPLEAELVSGDKPLVLLTHKNGKFTLNDLSKYYKGLKLPKGEGLFESIGITTR